jgi:hypothetical protein
MLPKIGGRPEFADKLFELFSAVGVTAKHVKAGKSRTEQHVVARLGEFGSATDRVSESRATRMSHPKRRKLKRQLCARFADQHRMPHLRRDPVNKTRYIASFGFAASDQHDRRGKTRQRRLDRMEVRCF